MLWNFRAVFTSPTIAETLEVLYSLLQQPRNRSPHIATIAPASASIDFLWSEPGTCQWHAIGTNVFLVIDKREWHDSSTDKTVIVWYNPQEVSAPQLARRYISSIASNAHLALLHDLRPIAQDVAPGPGGRSPLSWASERASDIHSRSEAIWVFFSLSHGGTPQIIQLSNDFGFSLKPTSELGGTPLSTK